MREQVRFALHARNPDVLTCIANLSNDEVFTPPEFANKMLDTLADAWAAKNEGANIWADKGVKFLDPMSKTGVFLREITTRLSEGLEDEIPDLEERVDHILTKQVFGIGITYLTSLLARRSVYCSKDANGRHSVAKSFATKDGNIWFRRMEHSWVGGTQVETSGADGRAVKATVGGRCKYCGAGQSTFERAEGLETHAYAFVHTDNIKATVAAIFGDDMQFDVVVGNPPYQIEAEGNTRTMPIYQKFVDAAIGLDPKYVLMITPSRWFAGGLGLDGFRERMLNDERLKVLVDYPSAGDVFPGVEIKGGVSYFLWEQAHKGETTVVGHSDGSGHFTAVNRRLDEFDVHIRYNEAVPVLRKVLARKEPSLSALVSAQKPFGLQSNQNGALQRSIESQIELYGTKQVTYVSLADIPMNRDWVKYHKVLVSEAYGASDSTPHQIIGRPFAVGPQTACTQTYLVVGRFDNADEADSLKSYLTTRFVRFLVSLRKISQHTKPDTYLWVPQQSWDRVWTDAELYEKYDITDAEIAFIESMIRPMDLTGDSSDE